MKEIYRFLDRIRTGLSGEPFVSVSLHNNGFIQLHVHWESENFHVLETFHEYAKYLPENDMWADYLIESIERKYKIWTVGEE